MGAGSREGVHDPPVTDFLGLDLWKADRPSFARWLAEVATRRERSTLVGYVNAATFDNASRSRDFAEILRSFDVLVPDGQAVVWAARWLGSPVAERVNVGDVMVDSLRAVAGRGLTVAAIGGPDGQAEAFAAAMTRACPGLDVTMTASGYLSPQEELAVRHHINERDPDVVLVGMGSPRQESAVVRWAAGDEPRIWWCVGAAFEAPAGTRPRAPEWMRRAGLEWLFRLALEPRRLARRYLVGNPRFVWSVLRRRRVG